MKYYFFIRLVSYEYKLQQIIKITIIHKIKKYVKNPQDVHVLFQCKLMSMQWCVIIWQFLSTTLINKLYKCNDLKAGINIFVQKIFQPHIINEYKCNDSKARFNIFVKFFSITLALIIFFLNNIWSLFIFNNRQFCQKTHSYTHKERIYF